MKKMIAILMCMLMLLGSALAEQEMQAWTITVDNITVNYKGETIEMNPTLLINTGRDAAGCWAQVSVMLNGSAALAGQVEYVGDTLFGSVDGAKDALLVEGADLFLNQYGLSAAQAQDYAGALFGMLSTGVAPMTKNPDPKTNHFDFQVTGENEVDVAFNYNSFKASAHIAWERAENKLPYDLSEKNVCRYTFREMFPGDGTDIPEVVNAALDVLSADDSIRELTELLSVRVAM